MALLVEVLKFFLIDILTNSIKERYQKICGYFIPVITENV